ncbi:hypothetical protein ABZ815_37515 [Nonomuraea sp. NPDC047529]|uniref:hypothetical protein n=1 Tax=Nonomuraea sp. NPDC047529 TaxID=3155623 RepID=UPI003411693F
MLTDFLGAGPAPVFVGFGGLAGTRAEPYTELVVDALRRAGLRGVVQTGREGPITDDVLGVGDVRGRGTQEQPLALRMILGEV